MFLKNDDMPGPVFRLGSGRTTLDKKFPVMIKPGAYAELAFKIFITFFQPSAVGKTIGHLPYMAWSPQRGSRKAKGFEASRAFFECPRLSENPRGLMAIALNHQAVLKPFFRLSGFINEYRVKFIF
jgi:hypothetical protein